MCEKRGGLVLKNENCSTLKGNLIPMRLMKDLILHSALNPNIFRYSHMMSGASDNSPVRDAVNLLLWCLTVKMAARSD